MNEDFVRPDIIKNKIIEYLEIDEEQYENFIKLLKKYNAIIAGGFVLSCVSGFAPNDIDIYITAKNMKNFACSLPSFLTPHGLDFISKYDSIGKKYVQRMLCYKYDEDNNPNYDIKVDIVIIDDNYTVEQVIDNFDLSFCKIWFDGDNVIAKHPKDIINRKGSLNKKYLKQYYKAIKLNLQRSDLIYMRYTKYTQRGFTITVGKEPAKDTQEEADTPLLLSNRQTSENYIVKLLLQNFTNNNLIKYFISDIKFLSKYMSKYISMYYYTEEFNQRDYIQKITLFKFYFICLFNEFTFKEYVSNFNKLFFNTTIQYAYKTALYTLEDYLLSFYNITTTYNYTDSGSISFANADDDSRVTNPHPLKIIEFIQENKLNKYEYYKFTRIIDYSYIHEKHKIILKDRLL